MNLVEVCRLCLVKSIKTSEELFFPIDEVFERKFSEITNFILDSSNGFPSTICISCVTEFEDFYNYRSGLIQKQKRLNLLLGVKIKSEVEAKKSIVTEQSSTKQESLTHHNDEHLQDESNQSENEGNKSYDNTVIEYEGDDEFMEKQEHSPSRMIFEEVLESDEEETAYEMDDYRDQKDIKMRDNIEYVQHEENEYVESGDDCVEEMEQTEDGEIYFAITSDEINDNCIIVKTEDGYLENVSGVRQKRKYIKQEKGKEKLYRCWIENCNAAFAFRSTMKKHMIQMHSIICDKKTCLMCGCNFEEYSDFLNHVKKHTRKSECDICKLTFVSEERMTAHRYRVHNNDRNERCFQCNLCEATFKRKEHLNSHIIYKHTEAREFHCKECSSAFLTRQDLKNHEKSHTQLKKNCPYCPYECRDLKSIKLHCLKVHNTAKIYKCTCEEAFEMYKDYQSHKKGCFSAVDSTTTE